MISPIFNSLSTEPADPVLMIKSGLNSLISNVAVIAAFTLPIPLCANTTCLSSILPL